MLAARKAASTILFTAPPRVKGLAATPSLVKVTLSLTPGIPAGDQFPPVDQSVSPARPLHNFCAPMLKVGVAKTPAMSMVIRARELGFLIGRIPKTVLQCRATDVRSKLRLTGPVAFPLESDFMIDTFCG